MKSIFLFVLALFPVCLLAGTFEDMCKDPNTPHEQRVFILAVLKAHKTSDCADPQREIDKHGRLLINSSDITDIGPIEGLYGVRELSIIGNNIADISPLSNQKSLEWLNLSYNNISDTSSLSELHSLVELRIDNNPIADISPLKSLKNLGKLRVFNTGVVDFKALENLTNLTHLYMGVRDLNHTLSCQGHRVNPKNLRTSLAKLDKLSVFEGGFLDFHTTKAFEDKKHLKSISLDCNFVTEANLIKVNSSLKSVTLSRNSLTTLSMVENENLRFLDLSKNRLTAVDFAKKVPNLTGLYLGGNIIQNASPLKSLSKLTKLYIDDNEVRSLSFLKTMMSLEELSANGNEIREFSFSMVPDTISWLYLGQNEISLVGPGIEKLSSLTELSLDRNPIKDISFFEGLSNERAITIDLSNTPVKDYSPLNGKKIRGLHLAGNNIESLDQLPSLEKLYVLNVSNNMIRDIEGLYEKYGEMFALDLSHNPIKDMRELSKYEGIYSLNVSYTELVDPSDVALMKEVVELDVSGVGLSNLSFLSRVSGLKKLVAGNNLIRDLEVFKNGFKELSWLDLGVNLIEDVTSISGLSGISYNYALDLSGNPLGTTIQKNPQNCPTSGSSPAVTAWCRMK